MEFSGREKQKQVLRSKSALGNTCSAARGRTNPMSRVAFHLRIRADRVEQYDRIHQNVWPELLKVIKDAGVRRYSIFRRGQDLFFYLEVDNFERAWSEIAASTVDQRWQVGMAPFFEPMSEPI